MWVRQFTKIYKHLQILVESSFFHLSGKKVIIWKGEMTKPPFVNCCMDR